MKSATCAQCEQPFERPTTGRPKKFCSTRCRVTNHRRMQRRKGDLVVPDELAGADRWVRWRATRRGTRMTKRPVTVAGGAASVSDVGTWSSLVEARRSEVGDGLGFVLGEGIGCIDLDDVISPGGSLREGAKRLLRLLPDTWVEVSPSGRGLHVWGLLPEGAGRVRSVGGVSVEVYSRARYMTVTGVPFWFRDDFGEWRAAPARLADLSEVVGLIL